MNIFRKLFDRLSKHVFSVKEKKLMMLMQERHKLMGRAIRVKKIVFGMRSNDGEKVAKLAWESKALEHLLEENSKLIKDL